MQTQFYKLGADNYPIIHTLQLEPDMVAYTVGSEPLELQTALQALAVKEAEASVKQTKELALSVLTVTTTAGNVFDAREKDIVRMLSAIEASATLGLTEKEWKLHDNSSKIITLAELKEAHALAIQAVGTIILSAV